MGKTKTVILFLPVIVVCVASIATGQTEQWLRYRYDREPARFIGHSGFQDLELSQDKPAGVQLPEFESARPLFSRWSTPMAKSGHLWIAVDRSSQRGLYDRLYIDSDGDGHLKGETAAIAYRTREGRFRTWFGPVRVTFEVEGGPVTYHLNFRVDPRERENEILVTSAGWYQGTITVGQKKRHCMLIDYNANGTFNDKSIDHESSDRIQVRVDQKAQWDTRLVGNYLQLGRELFELEVARDGAYLKLAKADDVSFGDIRVPESITELSAGGDNGLFFVVPDKQVGRLPVGRYRIQYWAREQKDEKGNLWKLESQSWSEDEFEVSQTNETPLRIGELFARVSRVRQVDANYHFYFDRCGAMDEQLRLLCNNQQVRGEVRIRDKAGTFDRNFQICIAPG
ncbi:MAG: hypothetical protein ACYTBJ_15760 [Planctomycetota bacterium]|jgi:hypothetical protein